MPASRPRLLLPLALLPYLLSGAAESQPASSAHPVFVKAVAPEAELPPPVLAAVKSSPAAGDAGPVQAPAPGVSPAPASEAVVLLPKVTVVAGGQALPEERSVLSRTDKAEILRKRYPGASLKGQDPERSRVPNYAALMYREDERLSQLQRFHDLAAGMRLAGETQEALALEKDAKLSLMRRHDLRSEAMDRSANNERR